MINNWNYRNGFDCIRYFVEMRGGGTELGVFMAHVKSFVSFIAEQKRKKNSVFKLEKLYELFFTQCKIFQNLNNALLLKVLF